MDTPRLRSLPYLTADEPSRTVRADTLNGGHTEVGASTLETNNDAPRPVPACSRLFGGLRTIEQLREVVSAGQRKMDGIEQHRRQTIPALFFCLYSSAA